MLSFLDILHKAEELINKVQFELAKPVPKEIPD